MNDSENTSDPASDGESKVDSAEVAANAETGPTGSEPDPSETTSLEPVAGEGDNDQLADTEFKILSESVSESVVAEIHVIEDDAGRGVAEFRKEVAVEAIVVEEVVDADADNKPPVAIDPGVVAAAAIEAKKPPPVWQHRMPSKLAAESIASTGGAVGSVALGVLSIIGGFITPFSLINSALGIVLGAWGLSSPRKRLAGIGMLLCVIGVAIPFAYGLFDVVDNLNQPVEKDIFDEASDF